MNTCKYCQKTYSSKHNLLRHQKTTISCLSIRNEKPLNSFSCEFCQTDFVHKSTLMRHYSSCSSKKKSAIREGKKRLKIKYEEELNKEKEKSGKLSGRVNTKIIEIKELKKINIKMRNEISELKNEVERQRGVIEGMKTAPDKRTIYNTAIHPKLVNLPINNIRALTDEYVIERVNDGILTYEKAARGYPGMLDVICDLITYENDQGVIERNYVCTDVSRNSFHRLLESKKWKSDKGGRYLNNMLDTFRDIMEEHKDKVYKRYKETPHDSIEWENVEWERKKISQLYSGVVCNEGTGDREDLVNILRKEISRRASV